MSKRVVILGGGPSGLGLAWKLAEMGIPCDVIEAETYLGGHSGSYREDGYVMDFGPHSFFSEDHEVFHAVMDLFDGQLPYTPRTVRLYMKGKYLKYPLSAEDIVLKLGLWTGFRCFLSYICEQVFRPYHRVKADAEDVSVDAWARHRFGPYLHELFFKPYTEQFWSMPCTELSADAIPTSKKLSFFRTLKLLVFSSKQKDNLSVTEREMLPSYYPRKGFGEIYERIAELAQKKGARIHPEWRATGIERRQDNTWRVTCENGAGESQTFDGGTLVSTIPLNETALMLSPAPPRDVLDSAKALDFLSLVVLYIITEKDSILECQYEYSLGNSYNRISDMNKFSPETSPPGQNMLAVEFSSLHGDEVWTSTKEDLLERCLGALETEGIVRRDEVLKLLLVRTRHAYPMYKLGYKKHLERVKEYLASVPNMHFTGRVGEFMYMDSDQCLTRSFSLAKRIAEDRA